MKLFKKSKGTVCRFIVMITCIALLMVPSCKPKEQEKENPSVTRQRDSLQNIYQKNVALEPDSVTVQKLMQDFEKERKQFQNTVNSMYPGLLSKFEKDAGAMLKIKDGDFTERLAAIDQIETNIREKYYAKFKKAWAASGISDETIREKYQKRLGKVPYEVGEFGVGVIRQALGGNREPEFPADTVLTFGCPVFEVRETNSSCGLFAFADFISLGDCFINVNTGTSIIAGGCDLWAMLGKQVNVPSPVADLTGTCRGNYNLFAIAIGVAGVSYSSAMVGAEITDGNSLVQREHAKIWALAPIFWFARVSESRTAQVITVGFHKGAGHAATVNVKAYARAGMGGGGVGASAGAIASWSFVNGITVQMMR